MSDESDLLSFEEGSIGLDGLFGSEWQTWRTQNLERNAELFAFAREFHRFTGRIFERTPIQRAPLQAYAGAFLWRSRSLFQSIILLTEYGASSESRILTRSMLEVLFYAAAIARKPEFVNEYSRLDDRLRLRVFEKVQSGKIKDEDIFSSEELHQKIKELKSTAPKRGELTIWHFADAAGLLNYYDFHYEHLSWPTHVSPRHLESETRMTATREIEGFEFGPQETDLNPWLCLAAQFYIEIHEATAIMLSQDWSKELADFNAKLGQLLKDESGHVQARAYPDARRV